eukprot:Cvel_27126.t1-p1 / transcript=Cvel_27126.t1 / gene=Cvel_27126 / organism=Chromera_velia_CCMP2878 / gene_product=hypothetical protein / transcript_product=hypothetical protein / location=Cvel_scaffold3330:8016-17898(+) / protein_length=2246 / sequence_SO=supercontig / SO=protein_coding / is_pseudo=false
MENITSLLTTGADHRKGCPHRGAFTSNRSLVCADRQCVLWRDLSTHFGFRPPDLDPDDFSRCFCDVVEGGSGLYERLSVVGFKTLETFCDMFFFDAFGRVGPLPDGPIPPPNPADADPLRDNDRGEGMGVGEGLLTQQKKLTGEVLRQVWVTRQTERVTSPNALYKFAATHLQMSKVLRTRRAVAKYVPACLGFSCLYGSIMAVGPGGGKGKMPTEWLVKLVTTILESAKCHSEETPEENEFLQALQEYFGYKDERLSPNVILCILPGHEMAQRFAPLGDLILFRFASEYFASLAQEEGVPWEDQDAWVTSRTNALKAVPLLALFAAQYCSMYPLVQAGGGELIRRVTGRLHPLLGGQWADADYATAFKTLVAVCFEQSGDVEAQVWVSALVQRIRQVQLCAEIHCLSLSGPSESGPLQKQTALMKELHSQQGGEGGYGFGGDGQHPGRPGSPPHAGRFRHWLSQQAFQRSAAQLPSVAAHLKTSGMGGNALMPAVRPGSPQAVGMGILSPEEQMQLERERQERDSRLKRVDTLKSKSKLAPSVENDTAGHSMLHLKPKGFPTNGDWQRWRANVGGWLQPTALPPSPPPIFETYPPPPPVAPDSSTDDGGREEIVEDPHAPEVFSFLGGRLVCVGASAAAAAGPHEGRPGLTDVERQKQGLFVLDGWKLEEKPDGKGGKHFNLVKGPPALSLLERLPGYTILYDHNRDPILTPLSMRHSDGASQRAPRVFVAAGGGLVVAQDPSTGHLTVLPGWHIEYKSTGEAFLERQGEVGIRLREFTIGYDKKKGRPRLVRLPNAGGNVKPDGQGKGPSALFPSVLFSPDRHIVTTFDPVTKRKFHLGGWQLYFDEAGQPQLLQKGNEGDAEMDGDGLVRLDGYTISFPPPYVQGRTAHPTLVDMAAFKGRQESLCQGAQVFVQQGGLRVFLQRVGKGKEEIGGFRLAFVPSESGRTVEPCLVRNPQTEKQDGSELLLRSHAVLYTADGEPELAPLPKCAALVGVNEEVEDCEGEESENGTFKSIPKGWEHLLFASRDRRVVAFSSSLRGPKRVLNGRALSKGIGADGSAKLPHLQFSPGLLQLEGYTAVFSGWDVPRHWRTPAGMCLRELRPEERDGRAKPPAEVFVSADGRRVVLRTAGEGSALKPLVGYTLRHEERTGRPRLAAAEEEEEVLELLQGYAARLSQQGNWVLVVGSGPSDTRVLSSPDGSFVCILDPEEGSMEVLEGFGLKWGDEGVPRLARSVASMLVPLQGYTVDGPSSVDEALRQTLQGTPQIVRVEDTGKRVEEVPRVFVSEDGSFVAIAIPTDPRAEHDRGASDSRPVLLDGICLVVDPHTLRPALVRSHTARLFLVPKVSVSFDKRTGEPLVTGAPGSKDQQSGFGGPCAPDSLEGGGPRVPGSFAEAPRWPPDTAVNTKSESPVRQSIGAFGSARNSPGHFVPGGVRKLHVTPPGTPAVPPQSQTAYSAPQSQDRGDPSSPAPLFTAVPQPYLSSPITPGTTPPQPSIQPQPSQRRSSTVSGQAQPGLSADPPSTTPSQPPAGQGPTTAPTGSPPAAVEGTGTEDFEVLQGYTVAYNQKGRPVLLDAKGLEGQQLSAPPPVVLVRPADGAMRVGDPQNPSRSMPLQGCKIVSTWVGGKSVPSLVETQTPAVHPTTPAITGSRVATNANQPSTTNQTQMGGSSVPPLQPLVGGGIPAVPPPEPQEGGPGEQSSSARPVPATRDHIQQSPQDGPSSPSYAGKKRESTTIAVNPALIQAPPMSKPQQPDGPYTFPPSDQQPRTSQEVQFKIPNRESPPMVPSRHPTEAPPLSNQQSMHQSSQRIPFTASHWTKPSQGPATSWWAQSQAHPGAPTAQHNDPATAPAPPGSPPQPLQPYSDAYPPSATVPYASTHWTNYPLAGGGGGQVIHSPGSAQVILRQSAGGRTSAVSLTHSHSTIVRPLPHPAPPHAVHSPPRPSGIVPLTTVHQPVPPPVHINNGTAPPGPTPMVRGSYHVLPGYVAVPAGTQGFKLMKSAQHSTPISGPHHAVASSSDGRQVWLLPPDSPATRVAAAEPQATLLSGWRIGYDLSGAPVLVRGDATSSLPSSPNPLKKTPPIPKKEKELPEFHSKKRITATGEQEQSAEDAEDDSLQLKGYTIAMSPSGVPALVRVSDLPPRLLEAMGERVPVITVGENGRDVKAVDPTTGAWTRLDGHRLLVSPTGKPLLVRTRSADGEEEGGGGGADERREPPAASSGQPPEAAAPSHTPPPTAGPTSGPGE